MGQTWESRLAALKLAAKVADAEGERGVYAALFTDTRPAKPKRKKTGAASGNAFARG
ncbi:MAG TPA: hypothetical protein VK447_18830 [Myxococcaceae bacterium]|nr:hypothetical protein [Myxococcaceae bacterium]